MKKIFAYNLIIFFLLIFIIEILARSFNLSPLVGLDKGLLDLSSVPHQNNKNIVSQAFNKKVYTDQYGFRVPNSNYNYGSSKKSILILGDSVSFGVGVREEESIFGKLRVDFKNLNFYNSSVVGYNIKNYHQILNKYQNIENLDEVIVFFCINDIHLEQSIKFANNIEEKKEEKFNIILFLKKNIYFSKINNFLRDKSVFYVWFKNNLSNTSERYFTYSFETYGDKNKIIPIKKYLNQIQLLTKKNNLNLSVIILPYEFQTRETNCQGSYIKPQKEISNILSKLQIEYFDYTQEFCKFENPSDLFLKYDPVHLSKKGHEYVSRLLKRDVLSK